MSCQQVPRLAEDPYTFTETPVATTYFTSSVGDHVANICHFLFLPICKMLVLCVICARQSHSFARSMRSVAENVDVEVCFFLLSYVSLVEVVEFHSSRWFIYITPLVSYVLLIIYRMLLCGCRLSTDETERRKKEKEMRRKKRMRLRFKSIYTRSHASCECVHFFFWFGLWLFIFHSLRLDHAAYIYWIM